MTQQAGNSLRLKAEETNHSLLAKKGAKKINWWLSSIVFIASSLVSLGWQADAFANMAAQGANLQLAITTIFAGFILNALLYYMDAPEALEKVGQGIKSVVTGDFFKNTETTQAQKWKAFLLKGVFLFGLSVLTTVLMTGFTAQNLLSFPWMGPELYWTSVVAFAIVSFTLYYVFLSKFTDRVGVALKSIGNSLKDVFDFAACIDTNNFFGNARTAQKSQTTTKEKLEKAFKRTSHFLLGSAALLIVAVAVYANVGSFSVSFQAFSKDILGFTSPMALISTLVVAGIVCEIILNSESAMDFVDSLIKAVTDKEDVPTTQEKFAFSFDSFKNKVKQVSWKHVAYVVLGTLTLGAVVVNSIGNAFIAEASTQLIPGLNSQIMAGIMSGFLMLYAVNDLYKKSKEGTPVFPQDRSGRAKMWLANGLGLTVCMAFAAPYTAAAIGAGKVAIYLMPTGMALLMLAVYLLDKKFVTLNNKRAANNTTVSQEEASPPLPSSEAAARQAGPAPVMKNDQNPSEAATPSQRVH